MGRGAGVRGGGLGRGLLDEVDGEVQVEGLDGEERELLALEVRRLLVELQHVRPRPDLLPPRISQDAARISCRSPA